MTGAMYAAIAGLKTHMSKMNVIGNNIANVNTAGFKSQRTVFKDAMYTMYKSGSNGTETVGSMNPAQIGYGSQISTIDLNMSAGSYAPGNTLDCMIDGDGFFLVGDKDVANVIDGNNPASFKSLGLTRVGDFSFGADGYLVDGNSSCVYGFLSVGSTVDGDPIVSDQLVPIRLPKMETVYELIGNVDPTVEPIDAQAYEALDEDEKKNYEAKVVVRYPVVAANGTNAITNAAQLEGAAKENFTTLTDYDAFVNANNDAADEDVELAFAQLDSISIDSITGRISGTTKDSNEWVTIGFIALGNVTNPNGVSHTGGFYYTCGDGAGDLQVSLMGGAAENLTVPGGGTLQYVNGSLATPAADAADDEAELSNKAAIGSAGTTKLLTGGLEQSNVDLATEISEMITTQRGYQANTRIITVTDTMLEELVNMKR